VRPYYDDGRGIVIFNADCRDVLPTLAKGSVDLVLTDPPYGTGKLSVNYNGLDKHDSWTWDEWIDIPMLGCPQIYFAPPNQLNGFDRLLVAVKTQTTCVKNVSPRYGAQFIVVKGKLPNTYELDWCQYTPVYGGVHPTEKSLHLMRWLVLVGSVGAQTILDPFMGSGTTLVAAKTLGRRAIGIEISEEYCRIAVQRLQQEVLPMDESAVTEEQSEMEVSA
jgi:site-specific DNA-methyltransferase (adenine-specific)